jgi:hypothetical protein
MANFVVFFLLKKLLKNSHWVLIYYYNAKIAPIKNTLIYEKCKFPFEENDHKRVILL